MPKKKSPRSLEDMFSRKPGMFPGGNGKKTVLNADEEDLEAPLTPLETEMGRLMHQLGRALNVAKATDEEELEHDGIGYFALIMNKLDELRETLQPFGPPEVPFEHGKPEEGD